MYYQNIQEINYSYLLPIFAEGIRETDHPYVFLARQGFIELILSDNTNEKVKSVLPQIIQSIRNALLSKDNGVFDASLISLEYLSNSVKNELNQYLKVLYIFLFKYLKRDLI